MSAGIRHDLYCWDGDELAADFRLDEEVVIRLIETDLVAATWTGDPRWPIVIQCEYIPRDLAEDLARRHGFPRPLPGGYWTVEVSSDDRKEEGAGD